MCTYTCIRHTYILLLTYRNSIETDGKSLNYLQSLYDHVKGLAQLVSDFQADTDKGSQMLLHET